MSQENTSKMSEMEKIISLCKRRGFIYQGSEIYGGLAGTWDYAPLGVALKRNIEQLWWKRFVLDREDMYGMDAAILMNQNVWKASGHVDGFADPLVECKNCKKRFRNDHYLEAKQRALANDLDFKKMSQDDKEMLICSVTKKEHDMGPSLQFNMMFKTHVGAFEDSSSISYLRPETAAGMFVNFKNVVDSFHPKLPFGMAQIGKAFRNEIAPRDFIFRVRELEQMEIEYFVKPEQWKEYFENFRKEVWEFTKDVGLSQDKLHELEVADGDRAHYSKRTIDFEFDYPFGRKELYGLAYRTDFDLKSHTEGSKVDLSYFDEETKERIVPHVIEPSFGVGRTLLAVISDAYSEDNLAGANGEEGEVRTFLKFSPKVAPVLVAVFPLLKNKPALIEKSREVFADLKKKFGRVAFDDNGNIGKRYRRQDEIGTPYCVTIDFDTLEKDGSVTLRDRDTGKQERIAIADLAERIGQNI